MTELLAMTCDACGEPMLPNVSTLDEHGCLWICINPRCPELRVGELEAGDLVEAGVPASWGTGSHVEDQALAGRLTRLIDHYLAEREAPPRTRERAHADLASLRGHLLEMGRLAEVAGAVACHLDGALSVSYLSDEFAEAQDAKQALAVVAALCATVGRTVADAASRLHGVDSELPGFMALHQG
jgi:hypothetical protein